LALEIRIDRSACRGSRSCVRRAPGTFSLDASRKSVAAEHPRESGAEVRAAANACPFFAIEVREIPDTSSRAEGERSSSS
jgi:ferredoxin